MKSRQSRPALGSTKSSAPRVLIIEDEADHLDLILEAFNDSPYPFDIATSQGLEEGRSTISRFKPHIILTDWRLKDGSGEDLLPASGEAPPIPVVVMTAWGSEETVVEVMKRGAMDYFVKPDAGGFDALPKIVHRALEVWTRRKEQLEEEQKLVRAQRLAEIGTLVSNVAHRLNNTFASIHGYSKLVLSDLSRDEVTAVTVQNLEKIASVVTSTQGVVQGILSLAPSGRKADYFVIRRVLEDCIRVLRSIFPANVSITEDIAPVEGACFIVAGELENVFTTIMVNAKEALGTKGGNIKVILRLIEADFAEPGADLIPGEYAEVIISDNGEGIDPLKASLIFKPFYTSKPTGTGLGLSIARSAVRSLGGDITFKSEPGKGTSFRILIPTSNKILDPKQQDLDFSLQTPLGHGETILLVEDDPGVLDAMSQFLNRLDYRTLPAKNIQEALVLLEENLNAASLLLTDYDLPDGTGVMLLQQLRRQRYKKPIILFSGFSQDLDQARARDLGFEAFFRKPLEFEAVARQIEFTLRGKP